jgi:predicted trehalose synthase
MELAHPANGPVGDARCGEFCRPWRREIAALLRACVMDKALYQVAYELNNRPDR